MTEKRLCGYYNYTVVLTYLGMLTGFLGIIYTMEGAYRHGILCLMIAGVCDMFDGTIAATKERDALEKRFGIQIDSLSDLICFGALPALLTYCISGKNYWGFGISCLYILCALIRLAYFNVLEEERQKAETGGRPFFMGLPVTSAALILPAFYEIGNGTPIQLGALLTVLMVIMAAAFVLPIKVNKPYLAGKVGMICAGIVELIILLPGLGMDV